MRKATSKVRECQFAQRGKRCRRSARTVKDLKLALCREHEMYERELRRRSG